MDMSLSRSPGSGSSPVRCCVPLDHEHVVSATGRLATKPEKSELGCDELVAGPYRASSRRRGEGQEVQPLPGGASELVEVVSQPRGERAGDRRAQRQGWGRRGVLELEGVRPVTAEPRLDASV